MLLNLVEMLYIEVEFNFSLKFINRRKI